MASTSAPARMDGDFAEHMKTYNAFLLILKISGATTAIVLLLLYFFLAR